VSVTLQYPFPPSPECKSSSVGCARACASAPGTTASAVHKTRRCRSSETYSRKVPRLRITSTHFGSKLFSSLDSDSRNNLPSPVVRRILKGNDAAYFTLELYLLMCRNGLSGLSSRRSSCLVALETLIKAATVIQVPCDDIFVYKPFSLGVFKAEYD